jgi:Tfp pilus assembly protein PilF
LIDAKQFSEAIEVFTLNSRLYPSSSGATDSLGQAFYRAGQKQMALESFRKSLERNAEDQIAKNWIRILSSGE